MITKKSVFFLSSALSATLVAVPTAAQTYSDAGVGGVSRVVASQPSATEFLSIINDLGRAVRPPKFVSIQGIGSGTVVPGGVVFGSISGTDHRNGPGPEVDGSLAFGVGFGNADGGIGGQITANITSTEWDNLGDSGYLSAKVGTRILPSQGYTYAASNFDGIAPWGDSSDMDVRTTFAITTFQEVSPFGDGELYPLMLTAGVTSHQGNERDLAPIAGAGISLSEHLSTSMSYNGDYLNAGFGVKLPGLEGAAATLTVNDIFDNEDKRRAVLAVSLSTSSLFGRTQ